MNIRDKINIDICDSIKSRYKINTDIIRKIVVVIYESLGLIDYELSISFKSSNYMRMLNLKHRKIDKSTDILSFPFEKWAEPITCKDPLNLFITEVPKHLGDLVISLDDVWKNALTLNHNIDRESCFLIIHGILHLVGHDHIDKEQEKIMLNEQRIILERLSTSREEVFRDCVIISEDNIEG